jgi:ferric-dicitrate binding protein FerR (iron transport regulator)
MNAAQQRQLESLLSALCDGTLEPAEQEQLDQLLRDSADCRLLYLQYIDMHARLSVHPNLTSGIPMDGRPYTWGKLPACQSTSPQAGSLRHDSSASAESVAAIDDDAVVLEFARKSLDRFNTETERARSRRKIRSVGRCLSLTLAVLIAVIGWQIYQQQRDRDLLVIRELTGMATIESSRGSTTARIGDRLRRGERLRTSDEDARAVLEFADGTRIVVDANSQIEVPQAGSVVHLRLLAGTMEVDAAPQPPDRPLVFATDHARYVVLGTRFRLYREAEASRLELDEGKVRLERQVDGQSVDVTAGHVAIANSEPTPVDVRPLASGRSKLRATLPKAGRAVAISPDGNLLATGDWERGLKTWNAGESAPRDSYNGKVGHSDGLALADGAVVHVGGGDGKLGIVTVWRPGEADAATIALPGHNTRSRALSPDGWHVVESSDDGTYVYRLDPASTEPKPLAELPDKGKAWCLALSDSAEFAAAGFWDGTLRVYRLGADVVYEQKLKHTPTRLALSGDGTQLAVFTQKDGLLLIDLATHRQQSLWSAGAAHVTCLCFTPDGRRLMAGLNDRMARVWSVEDGQALTVLDAGHVPHDIAWSAAQSLLATAGGQVNVWECEIP